MSIDCVSDLSQNEWDGMNVCNSDTLCCDIDEFPTCHMTFDHEP